MLHLAVNVYFYTATFARGRKLGDLVRRLASNMAGKSPAQLDQEAIEKFNRNLKRDVEREARLTRQYFWRGNKLPPFGIEPLPYERQRLANGGMTPEERALRKQWVMDQHLAPNEPVYVKELYPKNAIRRLLAAPWDIIFGALKPLMVRVCF